MQRKPSTVPPPQWSRPKRQTSEPFTLASSLGAIGWCGRISSFCSWWHGVGDGPVILLIIWLDDMGWWTYVALSADHLIAVELGGKSLERGLNKTTTEAENQVEGRLLEADVSHIRRLPPIHPSFPKQPSSPNQMAQSVPTFWML